MSRLSSEVSRHYISVFVRKGASPLMQTLLLDVAQYESDLARFDFGFLLVRTQHRDIPVKIILCIGNTSFLHR